MRADEHLPDEATVPDVRQSEASYVRGGGAAGNGPRVLRFVLAVGLLSLAALVVVLFVQAAGEQSRAEDLHRRGVPVTGIVTGCLGIASGTGITEASFRCSASFVQGGRHYHEVLRGSSALLVTGARVPAVVVPGDPSSLSTPAAAASGHAQSGWSRYAAALISLAVLVAYTAAVWLGYRRRSALLRNQ